MGPPPAPSAPSPNCGGPVQRVKCCRRWRIRHGESGAGCHELRVEKREWRTTNQNPEDRQGAGKTNELSMLPSSTECLLVFPASGSDEEGQGRNVGRVWGTEINGYGGVGDPVSDKNRKRWPLAFQDQPGLCWTLGSGLWDAGLRAAEDWIGTSKGSKKEQTRGH